MKTGGLLGVYNHEPSDDIKGPDDSFIMNTQELATAWEVGENICHYVNSAEAPVDEEVDRCSKLFSAKDSAFKYCFYQVIFFILAFSY